MKQAVSLLSLMLLLLAVVSANGGAPSKPTVEVRLKWLRTLSQTVAQANLGDFVIDFKKAITPNLNPRWDPKHLILSFNGHHLEDYVTLQEVGIEKGSIIGFYYYSIVGDTEIFTRRKKHKEWYDHLFVYLNMTVAQLRDIEASVDPNWDRKKIDLFLGDKKLEDKYSLEYYGIKKDDYVDVLNRNFE